MAECDSEGFDMYDDHPITLDNKIQLFHGFENQRSLLWGNLWR